MYRRTSVVRTALSLLFLFFTVASLGQQQTPADTDDDSIVVPAGTKITVHLDYGKREGRPYIDGQVSWPVRIGFSTLIPVGAKVRAEIFVGHRIEVLRLTQLTMGDKTYRMNTDAQQLMSGTAESQFTLTRDLYLD